MRQCTQHTIAIEQEEQRDERFDDFRMQARACVADDQRRGQQALVGRNRSNPRLLRQRRERHEEQCARREDIGDHARARCQQLVIGEIVERGFLLVIDGGPALRCTELQKRLAPADLFHSEYEQDQRASTVCGRNERRALNAPDASGGDRHPGARRQCGRKSEALERPFLLEEP